MQYLSFKGIGRSEFYAITGIKRGLLDKDKLKSAVSDTDIAIIIATFKELSPDWLLTGKEPMLRASTSEGIAPIYRDNQERIAVAHTSDEGIPLIPLDAVAGFGTDNSRQVLEYECEKYVVPMFRDAEFLIQVRGNSMYPKYSSGDIVACKKLPLDTFFQGNKVYVVDTEQGVLIKRVKKGKDEDHIILVSENERYEPFMLHRKDIYALAIVIGVIGLE